tara:strand:- start:668 stop:895 length:228 start_codon:yes stop_codon:yes gene_type:complete
MSALKRFTHAASFSPFGEKGEKEVAQFVVAQTFNGLCKICRAVVDRIVSDVLSFALVIHGGILDVPHRTTCSTLQ